ncbi:unnamed protein product [Ostreobium quekettii]|uniref:F-box/LRR-repeat protein 15-like leucin rich repeat domain-containing protein n=1 Tax=Ostreobium quekettii TaxID=121088 RepID=A0A8S1J6E7_9CHLO|nr:unnamed protein product [Ostreobium quekettii]
MSPVLVSLGDSSLEVGARLRLPRWAGKGHEFDRMPDSKSVELKLKSGDSCETQIVAHSICEWDPGIAMHQVAQVVRRRGWGFLPTRVLDRIKEKLEQEEDAIPPMLPAMRAVNHHWCAWASAATRLLVPSGGTSFPTMAATIRDKLPNVLGVRLWRYHTVTDDELQALSVLPRLTHLDLRGCGRITDSGLGCLTGLRELAKLDLGECDQITDAGLRHVGVLPLLSDLTVSYLGRLTDGGMRWLGRLQSVTSLDLSYCDGIRGHGFSHLAGMTRLRRLHLSGCGRLADEGIRLLRGFGSLASIDLLDCVRITDAGVEALGGIRSLTHLDLCGCAGMTDRGLSHLSSLVGLLHLNLGHCGQITDRGLARLKGLTNLRLLNLSRCRNVTDETLGQLGAGWSLPGLTSLNVSWCTRITSLRCLDALTNLTRVNCCGCTGLVQEGLACRRVLALLT